MSLAISYELLAAAGAEFRAGGGGAAFGAGSRRSRGRGFLFGATVGAEFRAFGIGAAFGADRR